MLQVLYGLVGVELCGVGWTYQPQLQTKTPTNILSLKSLSSWLLHQNLHVIYFYFLLYVYHCFSYLIILEKYKRLQ
uniref:Uncharacterized protein n=1 Tax=Rhizophora mucronata TaxID=61149 RepID=A0A2P2PJT3_RHIMU